MSIKEVMATVSDVCLQGPAQTVADQGKHHDSRVGRDIDEDFFDLPRSPNQRPVMLFRFDAFELRQAGPRDAVNRLAGRVGDKM